VSKTLSFRDIKPSDARVMGESAMGQLVTYAAEGLVHSSLISHTLTTYIHTSSGRYAITVIVDFLARPTTRTPQDHSFLRLLFNFGRDHLFGVIGKISLKFGKSIYFLGWVEVFRYDK
jgi:hypothetical protein